MSHFHKRKHNGSDGKSSKKVSVDETMCVNTIRTLSADMVEAAKSGHPGAPMGCAPMGHLLFGEYMKFNPKDPKWSDRDRFVLSNGHSCALLYSLLHLTGYNLPMNELKKFRQLHSSTPGHPENFLTEGVEVSTGPLGQGISNAVGMAMSEKHLAAIYNKDDYEVVNHHTWVICGDGCLQEGVSSEACSLAGHLGLGKLMVLYDDNHITIDGDTALSFTEDVKKRYESYNWQVLVVDDGTDLASLRQAIESGLANSDQPTMIKIRTNIGQNSSKEGKASAHGAPLGTDCLKEAKTKMGFDPEASFVVPEDVKKYYHHHAAAGTNEQASWNTLFNAYSKAHPALAAEYTRRVDGALPTNWKDALPTYSVDDPNKATRQRSEEVLNKCSELLVEIMGGSADLTPSNLTNLKCSSDFQKDTPLGRYIRFGVREHGMAAICNGIFAHGGIRPYCASFLNFIGYAMGSVRLSALSQFGVLYIMTHDSIGLGEDGPTHQPIEMLETLRCMPNLHLFRPCDGNEVVGSYICAMEAKETPSVLCFSRQGTPTLEGTSPIQVSYGAYVLNSFKKPDATIPGLVLVATGTEVALAVKVAEELFNNNKSDSISVVSMPCWELFEQQTQDYKQTVFPTGSPVMSIEASGTHGWSQYAHVAFGITNRFGLSAPGGKLYEEFGFTVPNLVNKAKQVLAFYPSKNAPSLVSRLTF
jgi:transketolase